jgi:activator of 2-hydroxyglutaryl-CoA dehydratase
MQKEMNVKDSEGYYVGIDAGSVSLNCVVVNQKKQIIYESPYKRHLGKVEEEVLELFQDLRAKKDKGRSIYGQPWTKDQPKGGWLL